ncbi:nucleoside/nucleotide kinase family protein [Herbiconiux sp. UC225_62]|uniref:nucleoside/nucleotide kinase family protein n=1 Tax=Herbiconiux sp. UC225_62 TaxID=3350168 RepID=UPI0036D3ED02
MSDLLIRATEAQLVARAKRLLETGERTILGIAGTPGAGKSTLCETLARELGSAAVVVGMDGFHLANDRLIELGRRDRKGAPDTFDVDGYVALLRRLRHQSDEVVYAPRFDRALEESIGSALAVPRGVPLVITEGNYLLLDSGGWERVGPLLDESWYLDIDPVERRRRLIDRRTGFGDDAQSARTWVETVDERNAVRVEAVSRARADLRVRVENTIQVQKDREATR